VPTITGSPTALLDLIDLERVELPASGDSTPIDAVAALEPVLVRLLERMTADRDGFQRHMHLIDDHPELAARDSLKMQGVSLRLRDLLVAQRCPAPTATLAAEIAMACYWTARRTTQDPAMLVEATRFAFHQVVGLGAGRTAS